MLGLMYNRKVQCGKEWEIETTEMDRDFPIYYFIYFHANYSQEHSQCTLRNGIPASYILFSTHRPKDDGIVKGHISMSCSAAPSHYFSLSEAVMSLIASYEPKFYKYSNNLLFHKYAIN